MNIYFLVSWTLSLISRMLCDIMNRSLISWTPWLLSREQSLISWTVFSHINNITINIFSNLMNILSYLMNNCLSFCTLSFISWTICLLWTIWLLSHEHFFLSWITYLYCDYHSTPIFKFTIFIFMNYCLIMISFFFSFLLVMATSWTLNTDRLTKRIRHSFKTSSWQRL